MILFYWSPWSIQDRRINFKQQFYIARGGLWTEGTEEWWFPAILPWHVTRYRCSVASMIHTIYTICTRLESLKMTPAWCVLGGRFVVWGSGGILVCALCSAILTAMCFEFVSRDIFHCTAETHNTLANVQFLTILPVSIPATRWHKFHIGFRIVSRNETELPLSGLAFLCFPTQISAQTTTASSHIHSGS
jgi:hypothetical protein